MWIDILVVAVSLLGSFFISMYTVNSRIDKEREREIERWYVDAGVQADLASKEYSNEILSEKSTGNDTVEVLRSRAEELQQHAAEGRYLGVDESIWSALRDISMNYQWIASEIESNGSTDWSELTDLEDEMWELTDMVSENIPSETEYSSAKNGWLSL
jgi:hypothetical protein